jgi:hypothetical protein
MRILILMLTIHVVVQAQTVLTPTQIQSAIEKGQQYKGTAQFLKKGLRGIKISVGPYIDVTFCNDWQVVALKAADAKGQMRELKPNELNVSGPLHAFMETKLTLAGLRVKWDDIGASNDIAQSSNLVLMTDNRAIQPTRRSLVQNHGSTIVLGFDFVVEPAELEKPLTVISVDGDDGRKHQKKNVDLSGILNVLR